MGFNLIVACTPDGLIGIKDKNNNYRLPWYLPEDLKHFREVTTGHIVVMGRKTYDSIPNRPLKNRINIVLTNNSELIGDAQNLFFTNLENIFNLLERLNRLHKGKKIFIAGGSEIYNLFYNKCATIYMSVVYGIDTISNKEDGHIFFPIDMTNFEIPSPPKCGTQLQHYKFNL